MFISRYGADRANQFQPFHSLIDAGIPVAIGSDGPWNPYLNIMLASTFGRHPGEAIGREQAVVAYTLTSAYAEFAENDKGSLEPDKLADLAVLSQDIFSVPANDLPKTESVLTMVGRLCTMQKFSRSIRYRTDRRLPGHAKARGLASPRSWALPRSAPATSS
jgi:predicted amidohydrolase YtcJ